MRIPDSFNRQGRKYMRKLAPTGGENTRDSGDRIAANQAIAIENYLVTGDGRLVTRKGYSLVKDTTFTQPQFVIAINNDLFIYGYTDTVSKVASYVPSTDTTTVLKSYSTANPMCADIDGEEVYIANGDEVIGYTDGSTYTQLTNSPQATQIAFYEFAGYTFLVANDVKYIKWSKGNSYNNWTETSAKPVDDPGVIRNERLGAVKKIGVQDQYLFILYENAINAYHFEAKNADGDGLAQLVVKDFESTVLRGISGIGFDKGFVYTHEDGISILNVVQGDKDEFRLSDILGEERMNDLDFSKSKVFYDGQYRVLITCATAAGSNNLVLVYDLRFNIWTTIPDWSITDFTLVGNEIYAIDILGNIIKLFDGFDDGGKVINYRILYKEEDFGDINTLKNLEFLRLDGSLSPSSSLSINYNIWGIDGSYSKDSAKFKITGIAHGDGLQGVGKNPVGKTTYEDIIKSSKQYDVPVRISKIRKAQVEINSSDDVPHVIKSVGTEYTIGRSIYQNNITRI